MFIAPLRRSFALASICLLAGCLAMQQPATVSASATASELMVAARRALSEQGLTPGMQDEQAGVLYSDWVVHGSTDDSTYIYRLVVLVDDGGASRSVTVRAETQYCPPNATVFDRCTASASKVVPKSVQDKIEAIGAKLAS